MSKKMINKLFIETAESVSENGEVAKDFLSQQEVDFNAYIQKGIKEINDFKKEPSKKLNKSQNYFKRAVLAAEIVSICYKDFSFGRIKFQKLIYLCEQVSNMEFQTNYYKQAAGPFDNKLMHTIDGLFKAQKWFDVKKVTRGKYTKVEFTPIENFGNHKPYYQKYFQDVDNDIKYIIRKLRKYKTNEVELVATIYYCWVEIERENLSFSNDLIIEKVYKWSKQKKKYSTEEIVSMINWMNENGIRPK
jgi:hypothetical protein